jgi:hypothetical protein
MWNHDLGHSQRILAFKYVSVGTNSSLIIDISVVLKYIYLCKCTFARVYKCHTIFHCFRESLASGIKSFS